MRPLTTRVLVSGRNTPMTRDLGTRQLTFFEGEGIVLLLASLRHFQYLCSIAFFLN